MTSTHLQFRAQFVLRKFRDVKYLLRDFFKCHVLISDNPSIMIKGMQKKMSGSSKLSTKWGESLQATQISHEKPNFSSLHICHQKGNEAYAL